ncbi:MAG: FAD-dependent oxidoreductase [Ignavibacteria bacterium]
MENIIIIGNGIAGITTARFIRKMSDKNITVISSESKYFYSRTALMYIYMGVMKHKDIKPYEDWFWEKNKINLINDYVQKIDTEKKQVILSTGINLFYDKLVIATGSKSNKFGWKGQDYAGVQGLYSLQDLDLMEQNTKGVSRAVIVGGGLIGIEMAEMLSSRNIPVTFLVREKSYWENILPIEESEMINKHIREHGMDLRLDTQLKEIKADNSGKVKSIITDKDEEIECQFVGLTAGVSPNIDLLKDTSIETGRGVLVNDYLETNVPGIYSAGDCVEIKSETAGGKNRIEQLWYTGRMHGEVVAKNICGKKTKYERGILFNSAKFLDIEYQTYGLVNFKMPGEKNLYWEDKDSKHSIRIVYTDEGVIGFNLMGIRYRQSVCEKWIKDKRSVEYVLTHLSEANFDPEFFTHFESAIVSIYNTQNPLKKITLKTKRWFFKKQA